MDEKAYLPAGSNMFYYYQYRRDMVERGEASLGPSPLTHPSDRIHLPSLPKWQDLQRRAMILTVISANGMAIFACTSQRHPVLSLASGDGPRHIRQIELYRMASLGCFKSSGPNLPLHIRIDFAELESQNSQSQPASHTDCFRLLPLSRNSEAASLFTNITI